MVSHGSLVAYVYCLAVACAACCRPRFSDSAMSIWMYIDQNQLQNVAEEL